MNLSVSNIAWAGDDDLRVYTLMSEQGYTGLEIAPTRVFACNPYDRLQEAGAWAANLKRKYGFTVPSMQSIWYGRTEKIFGTEEERQALINYTKKAIDFAEAINCKNLVFGCPKNRFLPESGDPSIAVAFFRELGEYAAQHHTVIGMEANPPIYNTNYINDTDSALKLIHAVNSAGFKLNLDLGTMICNDEKPVILCGNVHLINHVHISEPGLAPIQKRTLHTDIMSILKAEGYQGFISIEMSANPDMSVLEEAIKYVRKICG